MTLNYAAQRVFSSRWLALVMALCLLPTAAVRADTSAEATMQQLIGRVSTDLDALYKSGRIGDRVAIEKLIQADIVPALDRDRLARKVFRQYWKDVEKAGRGDDAQQRVLNSLVRTYAVALSSYSGDTITLVSVKANAKNYVAKSRLRRPTGETIHVEFNLSQTGDAWLINDMAVDGIVVSLTLFNAIKPVWDQQGIDAAMDALATADANTPTLEKPATEKSTTEKH